MKNILTSSVMAFIFLMTTSCGNQITQIPDADSSKWSEYTTKFNGFLVKYMIPATDGNENYNSYKKFVDISESREKDFVYLFLARYDFWRDLNHLELGISLIKYKNKYPSVPDFETFSRNLLAIIKDKNLNAKEVEIQNSRRLHLVLLDSNNRVRAENFRLPVTAKYFMSIEATYDEEFRDNPEWLASRRKIFKEFAENVKLIPPLHYQKKSSE